MQITDFQKEIYNAYLGALAKRDNRGYKKRENFDTFKEEDIVALNSLSSFMKKWDKKTISNFFNYCFEYLNGENVPFVWFASMKAIKAYKVIKNNKMLDADGNDTIKSFINGLKYIVDFCKHSNISLNQYKSAVNQNGSYWWFIHLSNHNITFYNCCVLDVVCDGIDDYCEIFFPDFHNKYEQIKVSYLKSSKLKKIGDDFKRAIGGC